VRYEERAGWGRERAASAALTVRLADGAALTHEIDMALGHPTRPLDDAALTAKFVDCAGRAARPLGPKAAEALAERLWRLEDEPDAGALF
jgi:2-methylcitrate dehydratase PrpD